MIFWSLICRFDISTLYHALRELGTKKSDDAILEDISSLQSPLRQTFASIGYHLILHHYETGSERDAKQNTNPNELTVV